MLTIELHVFVTALNSFESFVFATVSLTEPQGNAAMGTSFMHFYSRHMEQTIQPRYRIIRFRQSSSTHPIRHTIFLSVMSIRESLSPSIASILLVFRVGQRISFKVVGRFCQSRSSVERLRKTICDSQCYILQRRQICTHPFASKIPT